MCNTKEELWLPVKNWERYYEVSNFGNIRSLGRKIISASGAERNIFGKLLKPKPNKKRNNYCYATLHVNDVKENKSIHRMVAEAFINNPNNLPQINHKDFNPENNHVSNLEWCDAKYNMKYSAQRRPNMRGKFGRKIKAFNKMGEFVGEFGSIRDAARALNCHGQNICGVLSGKFKWVKGYTFQDCESGAGLN